MEGTERWQLGEKYPAIESRYSLCSQDKRETVIAGFIG